MEAITLLESFCCVFFRVFFGLCSDSGLIQFWQAYDQKRASGYFDNYLCALGFPKTGFSLKNPDPEKFFSDLGISDPDPNPLKKKKTTYPKH